MNKNSIENRKYAPYQRDYKSGVLTWEAYLKAYKEYAKRYGYSQCAERIAERGGFGDNELDEFFPEWRNYIVQP